MEPLKTMRLLALLAIGSLAACGGPSGADPDAGTPEDGGDIQDAGPLPVHPRLAPARLPFRLALPEINTSLFTTGLRSFDDGTVVGYREASFPVLGTLIAVAALPDRLVVVYPDLETGRMAVAHAGLDTPWQRFPLGSLALPSQVGAVDAIVGDDGKVLVALALQTDVVTLYEVELDGTVTTLFEDQVGVDVCPALRLGRSRAGDVDLFYKRTWWHRDSGASTWTRETLPYQFSGPIAPENADIGCVMRVAYDETDRPMVLGLARVWEPVLTSGGVPIDRTNLQTSGTGWTRTAHGEWVHQSGSSTPGAGLGLPAEWHEGWIDLESHPEGHIFSGPFVYDSGTQFEMELVSLRRDPLTVTTYPIENPNPIPDFMFTEGGDLQEEMRLYAYQFRYLGNLMKLTFSPCGTSTVYSVSWPTFQEDPFSEIRIAVAPRNRCDFAPRAPVFDHGQRLPNDLLRRRPVFAHGFRSYDAAVCVVGTDEMVVCQGAWGTVRNNDQADPFFSSGHAVPALVSTSIADGAVDVPTDTAAVTFTFDAPLEVDSIDVEVWYVSSGGGSRRGPITGVRGDTSVDVQLGEHVGVGTTIRVALHTGSEADLMGMTPPAVSFRWAGYTERVDPRDEASPQVCCATSPCITCATALDVDYHEGTVLEFALDADLDLENGPAPVLRDGNGDLVSGVSFRLVRPQTVDPYHIEMELLRDLEPSTSYTITLPPGSRTRWGAPLNDFETLRFTTQAL
jgi:hypothetical protein